MKLAKAALFLCTVAPAACFVPATRKASAVTAFSTTEDVSDAALIRNINKLKVQKAPTATTLQPRTKAEAVEHIKDYLKQYEGENGAHIIYTKLQENKVDVVNGFSGGAVLPLLDQFSTEHPRHQAPGAPTPIRWITNSNENSAGHIAEGYAKAVPFDSENLPVGVVVATSGPGVTNLITPLQDAICDGVPILVLCGQAATIAPQDAFQSAPAVDLTKPCTKWSYQIKSAAELPMVMDYAFYIARNGRPGPVFVDLPKDLQNQVVTDELVENFIDTNFSSDDDLQNFVRFQQLNGSFKFNMGYAGQGLPFEITKNASTMQFTPVADDESNPYLADHTPSDTIYFNQGTATSGDLAPDSDMTKSLGKLIAKAKKPVIIAGQGCNDSQDVLKEFAETLQIPVCTTLHALGCFDERNKLALNMLGMHGHPTPNFMVQEADLIINIGSRFDDRITGRIGDFVPEARTAAEEGRGGIIHVDIRKSEFSKQVAPTYFVHSTGRKFLETMNALPIEKPNTIAWLWQMKQFQEDFPVKIPHFATQNLKVDGKDVQFTPMSAQSVIAEMDKQLLDANQMDNAIFSTGVGVHQMVAAQLITWTQPRQMLSSGSLGTMGVSLGYSIGAKLANGKKIVISVDGDGSFNMTFTELKTLAEQKIPVKILLLDNDGQMMVEYWQRLFHDNRLLAVRNSHNPDYSKLAESFGIKSLYCDNQEELADKMREFLFDDPDEPVLFHLKIERTPCLPLVAPGQPLEDMILEDVEVEVDQGAAPS